MSEMDPGDRAMLWFNLVGIGLATALFAYPPWTGGMIAI